jgi:glutaminyl-tRNA synthetase
MNDTDLPVDFIRTRINADVAENNNAGKVVTRFPPEPNGYLHIGHAKSICLNFGVAAQFNGKCYLRFDDTNPGKESTEYKDAIQTDVQWLGFDWQERLTHASDYFATLYKYAVDLVNADKAYVDSLSADEIREYRGTLTEPGRNSPYRDRTVAENIDLLARMKEGEFADGEHVLRAKIDMGSSNMNMRDPTIYRIRRETHHQTGEEWCIYPMYDFTHCISDALESVTHSLCTLEFEDHRPLYDWFLDQLDVPCHPQQIEFARLNLNYTVTSKRKLNQLVAEGYVDGWDDPRMPTLSGLRRRGYSPEAIRDFCERIGVTKKDTLIDMSLLELCIREDLDRRARRVLGVLRPLKIVIENYPEGAEEEFDAPYHPNDESMGTRRVPFSRELYIEHDDFMESPVKKFFRLALGREVRLRYAYYITCTEVIKDASTGDITELRCSYDPETRGGWAPDGRKVKGTLHWVSAKHAEPVEVRLYDRLFDVAQPDMGDEDFLAHLNPDSRQRLSAALVEPSLRSAAPEDRFQFERLGYYCLDPVEYAAGRRVFSRTVSLRDSWAKQRG